MRGERDLPAGWRMRVREISAGVFEVSISDPHGRGVARTGINVDEVIEEVKSSARAMQSEVDGDAAGERP